MEAEKIVNHLPTHPKNLADFQQIQKVSQHPKNMKFQVKISQEKLGVDEQTGGEGAGGP
jgi:hypothetical protein